MEITTTLGALVDAEPALARVLAVKFDKDGGAKVRYHAAKLGRYVATETKHFYEERNALIETLGINGQLAPSSPHRVQFNAKVRELAALPITIPWGPLTTAMLDPYADITSADLVGLGPLYEPDPAEGST